MSCLLVLLHRNPLKVITKEGSLPFYSKTILCPKHERKYVILDKINFKHLPHPIHLSSIPTNYTQAGNQRAYLSHFLITDLGTEEGLRAALIAMYRMNR